MHSKTQLQGQRILAITLIAIPGIRQVVKLVYNRHIFCYLATYSYTSKLFKMWISLCIGCYSKFLHLCNTVCRSSYRVEASLLQGQLKST